MANPLDSNWIVIKHILRYLKGTLFHGLHFQLAFLHRSISLTAFCDANWASDIDGRQSTSSATIFLGTNLISWGSRKQQVVACSSIEAEYRNLAHKSAELSWNSMLITELHISYTTHTLLCDNQCLFQLHTIMFFIITPHIRRLMFSTCTKNLWPNNCVFLTFQLLTIGLIS